MYDNDNKSTRLYRLRFNGLATKEMSQMAEVENVEFGRMCTNPLRTEVDL